MIEFPDYDPDELRRILDLFVEDAGYRLTPEARDRAEAIIRRRWESRGKDFGNARMVRNLFEDMLGAHANRLGAGAGSADAERLSIIEADDVTAAARGR
jgi:AAA lid domain-containing protein